MPFTFIFTLLHLLLIHKYFYIADLNFLSDIQDNFMYKSSTQCLIKKA